MLIKKSLGIYTISLLVLCVSGCSTREHLATVRDPSGERITVGKVQKTIRLGMSNAEVIETLGSPNIVSTDDERREVWVYDKISTETVYSQSSTGGGIGALFLHIGVGGGLTGSRNSGAHSTTQRTLTIIIKFSKDAKVRDIAYHSSQF